VRLSTSSSASPATATVSKDAVVPPWQAATSDHDGPLPDLIAKIKNTMPQDSPGKLTAGQAADLAAYIQQAGKRLQRRTRHGFDHRTAGEPFPATGNLNQLMRGIMFPNSNIIFTVQTHDPAEKKKAGDAANAMAVSTGACGGAISILDGKSSTMRRSRWLSRRR
jgi:hypothetical protein